MHDRLVVQAKNVYMWTNLSHDVFTVQELFELEECATRTLRNPWAISNRFAAVASSETIGSMNAA